jgi:hypothetical protein
VSGPTGPDPALSLFWAAILVVRLQTREAHWRRASIAHHLYSLQRRQRRATARSSQIGCTPPPPPRVATGLDRQRPRPAADANGPGRLRSPGRARALTAQTRRRQSAFADGPTRPGPAGVGDRRPGPDAVSSVSATGPARPGLGGGMPPPLPCQPLARPAGGPGRREKEGGGAPAQWGLRPNIHSVLQVVRHPRRFPQPPAMLFTASFSGPPAARGPTAVRGPRQSGDSATRQSTRPRRPPATASASLLRRPRSRQSGGPGTTPPRPELGTLVTAGLSG